MINTFLLVIRNFETGCAELGLGTFVFLLRCSATSGRTLLLVGSYRSREFELVQYQAFQQTAFSKFIKFF